MHWFVVDFKILLTQQTGKKGLLSMSRAQVRDVLWIWSSPSGFTALHSFEIRIHFAISVTHSQ